jgi:peptidoglycan/LPS O-acetylase OafA/YrhL
MFLFFYFEVQSTFYYFAIKNELTMTITNKRRLSILLAVALLLLIPFISMQFTNEVNWSPFDFTLMGVLLLGTGLLGELVLRKAKNTTHRIVLIAVILAAFFLIWAELAVGIFGTPFAGS